MRVVYSFHDVGWSGLGFIGSKDGDECEPASKQAMNANYYYGSVLFLSERKTNVTCGNMIYKYPACAMELCQRLDRRDLVL